MLTPEKLENEDFRLNTLRSLNILDTPPEERFDRLTRMAKRIFNVPIAVVSLVDANRQWFKSCVGLSVRETSRDVSFCGHAILEDGILMVSDALADKRFYDNPLVINDPYIRFYAGCPLKAPNGSKLGTLCLIDVKPRGLDDEERGLLLDLALMAEQEIFTAQLATMDDLTLLSNRRGFEALAQHALNFCKRTGKPASMLFFDLNDFKNINDTFGHSAGDQALVVFADVLRNTFRDSDVIGRLGGDEFVALLTDTTSAGSMDLLGRLKQTIDSLNRKARNGYDIRYSAGLIEYDVEKHSSIDNLIADADKAMYADKKDKKTILG
jgi:diguanylate cyclase (GGDEF)-like protein